MNEHEDGFHCLAGLGVLALCVGVAIAVVYGLHLLAAYLLSR